MAALLPRTNGSISASALSVRAHALVVAIASLLASCLAPQLQAQAPSSYARHDPRDIRITLKARQALAQDSEVARFPIYVTVRQGNVVLWGQVPNNALAKSAVRLVSDVQGVFQVRSELVIGPVEPARDESPRLPGPIGLPQLDLTTGRRDPSRRGVLAGQSRRSQASDSVEMGRSTPLSTASPDTGAPAVLLTPQPLDKKETLHSALKRVIQSDVRFAGIRCNERAGAVTLSGTAARMEHVMELSRQVARLPGVKEVVVEGLRIAP